MAGHIVSKYLRTKPNYEVVDIARNSKLYPVEYEIDVEYDLGLLEEIISDEIPVAIINCIGLLIKDSNDRPDRAIYVNSYFPHWLEKITKSMSTKVIHISTDCVFDGKKGNYTEQDTPTETNCYGRSKSLGEIVNNKDLTIRTSIIGTELKIGEGLLEWALKQNKEVNGFLKVFWNGITTLELAKFIDYVLNKNPNLSGLYHLVSSYPINKAVLLKLIYEVFKKDIKVNYVDQPIIDKTLFNSRYNETNYDVPSYKIQLEELYNFIKK